MPCTWKLLSTHKHNEFYSLFFAMQALLRPKLLHAAAFLQAFAHRSFCVHAKTFSYRHCHTQTLWQTTSCAHRRFFAQKGFHTEMGLHIRPLHTDDFEHKRSWHSGTFTQRRSCVFYSTPYFHTQPLFHAKSRAHTCTKLKCANFVMRKLPSCFYAQNSKQRCVRTEYQNDHRATRRAIRQALPVWERAWGSGRPPPKLLLDSSYFSFDGRDLSFPFLVLQPDRSDHPSLKLTMHISGSRSSMQRPPAVQPFKLYTAFFAVYILKETSWTSPSNILLQKPKIERPNPRITEAMHLVRCTKARNMEACRKLLYIYAVANRHRNSTHSHRNTSHHLKQVRRKSLPRPDQHQF